MLNHPPTLLVSPSLLFPPRRQLLCCAPEKCVRPSHQPFCAIRRLCLTNPSAVSGQQSWLQLSFFLLSVTVDPTHHRLAVTPDYQLNALSTGRGARAPWGRNISALCWGCLQVSSLNVPSDAVSLSVSGHLLLPISPWSAHCCEIHHLCFHLATFAGSTFIPHAPPSLHQVVLRGGFWNHHSSPNIFTVIFFENGIVIICSSCSRVHLAGTSPRRER